MSSKRWLAILISAFAIAAAGACQQAPAASATASRAPDVPYEPTPHPVVTQMLALAQVGANDVVYDLGCGDGRIVIAAVKLGARGVCVDIRSAAHPRKPRERAARASPSESSS